MTYQSTKLIEGFSTCFRQWRATHSHCSFLHGYSISFKVTFEADNLDEKNWVEDFGFLKIEDVFDYEGKTFSSIKEWFSYMFDHTTVIARDDPKINFFETLSDEGVIDLRVLDSVGCEKFAEKVFFFLTSCLGRKRKYRLRVKSVECFENSKNSAIVLR